MYSNVLNVFNKLVCCASAIALCESSSGGFGKRQGHINTQNYTLLNNLYFDDLY